MIHIEKPTSGAGYLAAQATAFHKKSCYGGNLAEDIAVYTALKQSAKNRISEDNSGSFNFNFDYSGDGLTPKQILTDSFGEEEADRYIKRVKELNEANE